MEDDIPYLYKNRLTSQSNPSYNMGNLIKQTVLIHMYNPSKIMRSFHKEVITRSWWNYFYLKTGWGRVKPATTSCEFWVTNVIAVLGILFTVAVWSGAAIGIVGGIFTGVTTVIDHGWMAPTALYSHDMPHVLTIDAYVAEHPWAMVAALTLMVSALVGFVFAFIIVALPLVVVVTIGMICSVFGLSALFRWTDNRQRTKRSNTPNALVDRFGRGICQTIEWEDE